MIFSEHIQDPNRLCPDCEAPDLSFKEIPASFRMYRNEDGEEVFTHFGESRDYDCKNCGCEFTMTAWDDGR